MHPDHPSRFIQAWPGYAVRLFAAAGLALIALWITGWTGAVQRSYAQTSPDQATPTGQASPGNQVTPGGQVGDGQALFMAKCIGCHTIGGGKLVGPDLKDVTKTRDLQWIKNFIANPAQMIASDADAQALFKQYGMTMPALGLAPADVDALVAFLANPGQLPIPAAAPTMAGNAANGRQLFTGEKALSNGGTPCIACHSASGLSSLDGGSLGPDLTHVIQRLGEPGLTAALKTIAFPTMVGPFTNRALTAREQADVVAFLRQANGQPAAPAVAPGSLTTQTWVVFGIGLAGTLVLFGVLLIFWQSQKQSISARLRSGVRARPAKPKKDPGIEDASILAKNG